MRAGVRAASLLALLRAFACSPGGLVKQFEYEEEIYLNLDGSATVAVNASIPALIALRGLPLRPEPRARLDRAALRKLYEADGVDVTRVSRPWRRHGRRFVQVRLEVEDIRHLSAAAPFAWSQYRFDSRDGVHVYRQTVGQAAGEPIADVGWDGSELIGFRMHLPSRIVYHNAPSKSVDRGNILSWEQSLRDRLAGKPLEIDVRMEGESILYRTLAVFGLAAAAALALLAAAIYGVWRRGRASLTAPAPPRAR
jgi:hypothetical protein